MAARKSAVLEIRLVGCSRPRSLRLGRWSALLLLVVLPLVAVASLGASAYLVFHDDLLASLIRRQSDMQYAYEDRIAALKADLGNLSRDSAGARDVPSQAIRALATQSAMLEVRAAALERIAAGLGAGGSVTAPPTPRQEGATRTSVMETGALQTGALPTRLGSYADRRLDAVATSLQRAEVTEGQAAQRLREPLLRRLVRIDTALAETGLPPSRWRQPGAQGGPFVPLEPEATSLDESITLLHAASAEQARLRRFVDAVPLRRPLDGVLEVTSSFGPRIDPFLGRAALHTGIDLHEETGDAVKATAAGTVTIAGPDGGYGNLVEIDHGGGLVTRYGHLSAVMVVAGQRVAPGAIVGRVGATGRATGPHLHYETRIDGQPVDPVRFLKAAAILYPQG